MRGRMKSFDELVKQNKEAIQKDINEQDKIYLKVEKKYSLENKKSNYSK